MTKQNEQEALGTAMNKTEMFFEKNSKSMIIALLALFVLAAAIFGYRQLISQPRERKAAEMIAQAQYRFESTTPEYQLALEGDANGRGFQYPIPTYSITSDFDWSDTENNRLLFEMTAKYGTPYLAVSFRSNSPTSDSQGKSAVML